MLTMGLMDFFQSYEADPGTYLLILFIYTIAASVFLPIPVEIALVWNPSMPWFIKALVMGSGKAVGSIVVFLIGVKFEPKIRSWTRWGWFNWLVVKSQSFVSQYGYFALFAIMSIPGMPDTIPLYVFSLLNREGKLFSKKGFALTNFLAGIVRTFLIMTLWYGLVS